MPMRFTRKWDFDPGNKPVFLNDLTDDDQVRARVLELVGDIEAGEGLTAEEVRDLVAGFVTAGANVTVTHDDAGDKLTIAAADPADPGLDTEAVMDLLGTTGLVAGTNVTLSYNDAAGTITISAASGSGGGTDDQTAAEVPYDNASSGLAGDTVQEALDELAALPAPWVEITQAAYDALDPVDPDTLYVIVG